MTQRYDFQIRGIADGDREGDIGEATQRRPADKEPPAFSAAVVTGTTLTVTFVDDRELDTGSTPVGSAFSVSATPAGGTTRNIAGTGTATIAGKTATVTLGNRIAHGETVTVSYTSPGSDNGSLRDNSGNEVANFAGQPVDNKTLPLGTVHLTAYPDVCRPLGAECPGAPVGYVAPGPGHGQITMTWEPATTGAAVGNWQFRYKKTSDAAWPVLWRLLLSSPIQRSYTITNLDVTQAYDIQIRGMGARNGEGDIGEAARVKPADKAPPTFSAAVVTGTTLTVTFDDARELDTGSTPAGSAFSVSATPAGGTTRNIAGTGTATIAGKTATVTLGNRVAHGENGDGELHQPRQR